MSWTRQSLEALRKMDRPKVRCCIDRINVNEDGREIPADGPHGFNASISVDGNNPWLVGMAAGDCLAFRVSWQLVCEVLNDKWARPVHFDGVVKYEV